MLKIRSAQLDALEKSTVTAYLRRVRELLLTEDYEVVALIYDRLDEAIAAVYERARGHGLRQERSLTAFIRLWFSIGKDFDRHPLVARYLHGPYGTPDQCFDYLLKRVAAWEWERISNELPRSGS